MTSMYNLRNIEVRRNGGFSLCIEGLDLLRGRIYALAGPNGSGKTTLLRLLALLHPPDRGELRFAGESLPWERSELLERRRRVTMVDQSPYLFDRTVYQNLAFGLRLRGVRGEEQHRRIAVGLSQVGLAGFEARRARELSGGEAQRVALARALVLQPQVLLLDEPTANLDSQTILALEDVVSDLPRQGITVVMATHDPAQPERLGCDIVRLVGGRLAAAPESPDGRDTSNREKLTCLRPLKRRER